MCTGTCRLAIAGRYVIVARVVHHGSVESNWLAAPFRIGFSVAVAASGGRVATLRMHCASPAATPGAVPVPTSTAGRYAPVHMSGKPRLDTPPMYTTPRYRSSIRPDTEMAFKGIGCATPGSANVEATSHPVSPE